MTVRPHLRQEIAALAARLIADHGIHDYGQAKRKAARQLGAQPTDPLPDNREIEQQLQAYQSLYRDEEDEERLQLMREAAVQILRELQPFHPYLTGSVLDGTAGAFSEIEIELYPESAKEVEIYLLDQGVLFENRHVRHPDPDSPQTILTLDWDDIPVALRIYDQVQERSQRRSHFSGRRHSRAALPAVQAMLAATPDAADRSQP